MKFTLVVLALSITAVHAAGVHVHGESQLQVAAEGSSLTLVWNAPANDIAGFESAPQTQAQEQVLAQAMARAAQPLVDLAGACSLASVDIDNPFAGHHGEHDHDEHKHDEHKHDEHKHDEHKHDEHKHDEHKHDEHSEEEHADFRIEQSYDCASPASSLTFLGFDGFNEVQKVRVQWLTDSGAGQATLTPNSPSTEIE